MGLLQRQSLLDLVFALTDLQSKAMNDAVFLGWTEESLKAYEERRRTIKEIRAQLG